ncbi:MAG: ABC transporter ATP-binding protein [Oscillospiraceae bacterium]|nr:ABC transporter ATP-binding protein [Oscillospiraceae bacterium]
MGMNLLKVEGLACGYHGKALLRDVRFSLDQGQILCILGPNGVGKTTLFKTILGLLPPLGGSLFLNGSLVSYRSRKRTPKGISYVPQAHTPVFPFTVLDVAVMGRTAEMRPFATPSALDYERTRQVLDGFGLLHLKDKLYTEISGGERQLVLIARALVQNPQILIMDEPASSLDLGNQAKLLGRVRQLSRECRLGAIMTSHNPNHALQVADHVLLLRPGGACSFGPVDEIVTVEALTAAYETKLDILQAHKENGRIQKSIILQIEE